MDWSWYKLNRMGEVASVSRSPLSGCLASLSPSLRFILYLVSSCNLFMRSRTFFVMPRFSSIFHSNGRFTRGNALVMSSSTAQG